MGEKAEYCYFCEFPDDLEVHHIVPQRLGGTDAPDNIVTVCHECHWKLERLYNKDFYETLGIEDPRTTPETHITCEVSGCTNQAIKPIHVGRGSRQKGKAAGMSYRCEDHEEWWSAGAEVDKREREKILEFLSDHPEQAYRTRDIQRGISIERKTQTVRDYLMTLDYAGKVNRTRNYGDEYWQIDPEYAADD